MLPLLDPTLRTYSNLWSYLSQVSSAPALNSLLSFSPQTFIILVGGDLLCFGFFDAASTNITGRTTVPPNYPTNTRRQAPAASLVGCSRKRPFLNTLTTSFSIYGTRVLVPNHLRDAVKELNSPGVSIIKNP